MDCGFSRANNLLYIDVPEGYGKQGIELCKLVEMDMYRKIEAILIAYKGGCVIQFLMNLVRREKIVFIDL